MESSAAPRRIAIALSGGGHRACLFALGVLLYLADSGRSQGVTSIASVSGGSLANGAVAQALDYRIASAPEVETVVGGVARRAARGTLFATPLTWFYLLALVALIGAGAWGPWQLGLPTVFQIVVFVAALLLVAWFASLRGRVCAAAFARTLFSPGGRATGLAAINSSLDHVFCATDLHAGEHVYFSGRFVAAYRFGIGKPANLKLARVVQASAGFPGAFPVAWLRTKPHHFELPGDPAAEKARSMALVDGGVYDNMADQWAHGLENRSSRWAKHGPGFREADELVVVSASAGLEWGSVWKLRIPLLGELFALLRDEAVLYDNGNSVRRKELVSRFDLAARERRGLRGALVHIPQSPFRVPDSFVADASWPDRARRAEKAIALLVSEHGGADSARAWWAKEARSNEKVPTTLVGLGERRAAALMHHAYVLAMVNLHVILDYPLLALPARARFEALVTGGS